MYRIMLIPSDSPNPVALFYSARDNAVIAQETIQRFQEGTPNDLLSIKDDIGHHVTMKVGNLSYCLFIDADMKLEEERSSPNKKPSLVM